MCRQYTCSTINYIDISLEAEKFFVLCKRISTLYDCVRVSRLPSQCDSSPREPLSRIRSIQGRL